MTLPKADSQVHVTLPKAEKNQNDELLLAGENLNDELPFRHLHSKTSKNSRNPKTAEQDNFNPVEEPIKLNEKCKKNTGCGR